MWILNLSLCSSVNALYQIVTSMLRVDDGAPVEVTVFQTVDQDFGGGDVGGNRNVVDIADAQQVHLIGLIGLGADGVAEEEQHVHLFTGDARFARRRRGRREEIL